MVDRLQGRGPETAAWYIDYPLESQPVVRLIDNPQIGDRIADFLAFVKARPADDPIGNAEGDKTLFEFPHLETGPHQNRYLVK